MYMLYHHVYEFSFVKVKSPKTSKSIKYSRKSKNMGDNRMMQVRLQIFRGKMENVRMKEIEGVFEYIT